MERRSRSIESPRRHRNGGSGGAGGGAGGSGGSRRDYRRYSRSRSRSRNRSREREREYRRRSRSRERNYWRGSAEKDLYRDIINDDYQEENYHHAVHRGGGGGGGNAGGGGGGGYNGRKSEERFVEERHWNERSRDKGRDYEREHERDYRDRDYERERDRRDYRQPRHKRFSQERERDERSDESEDSCQQYTNATPSSTIIAFGLQPHITEADITSSLIQFGLAASSIRLIRKRITGASRGFAFVEFNTVEEAARWMDLTQSILVLPDQTRVNLQYSHSRDAPIKPKQTAQTDWYCGKCGIFNFKRRDSCFKCYASREESEKGGEGCDEISNILTKKIMLRNLDVLTNEEGVLTAMQQFVPDLAKRISKVFVSRDQLTQTSRGICYLHFDSLVDSMNVHNALTGLEPPLQIDNREVFVTYCIDHENREILPKNNIKPVTAATVQHMVGPMTAAEMAASAGVAAVAAGAAAAGVGAQYTLSDVPRLAEYSAAMYATTPAEHAHFLKYYTDYYIGEITSGQFTNLPTVTETSPNSAAAVALSAIQRKQKKMNSIETTATQAAAAAAAAAAVVKAAIAAAQPIVTPKGNDGKTYPAPDVTLYQYDETSGYYYDPSTGLYYDAHSQYYYNNETGAYLYWDHRKSTYVLATPAAAAATVQDVVKAESPDDVSKAAASSSSTEDGKKESKKEGGSGRQHDKVKVAKKIVKDMEKWAKQLNQKKDYTVVATPQPILPAKNEDAAGSYRATATTSALSSGYADVGFSILEKKERAKLSDYITPPVPATPNKLVSAYGSDSDDEHVAGPSKSGGAAATVPSGDISEKDYVDFQKLTCLLCKRAFQSLDILTKHLKMSNLHKENLQKYNLNRAATNNDSDGQGSSLSYRDRAKERRLKYGECDPPPPNRSRERFEKEIKNLTATARKSDAPAMPIGANNVGNRLLQKMGWSEGQGLGRKNQGRTNIIEASTRNTTAGLGNKATGFGPGDDYKTYIKKMMKSRYENA